MIQVTYRVCCSHCGHATKPENVSDRNAREARQLARGEGFRRIRVENGSLWDFCGPCYDGRKRVEKILAANSKKFAPGT